MEKQNRESHRTFRCQSVAWELPAGDFNFLNRIPNSHHCQNTRIPFEIGPCSYCSLFILFSKDVQQWILFDNKEKLVCENKTVDRKTRCALYQTTRHSLALKQSLEIASVIYLLVLIFRFFILPFWATRQCFMWLKYKPKSISKFYRFFSVCPLKISFIVQNFRLQNLFAFQHKSLSFILYLYSVKINLMDFGFILITS